MTGSSIPSEEILKAKAKTVCALLIARPVRYLRRSNLQVTFNPLAVVLLAMSLTTGS